MDLWLQIRSMFEKPGRPVKILTGSAAQGSADIDKLKASPDSAFGVIISNTAGIAVDNWLYILGQSSDHHAGVADFNARNGLDFGDMLAVATDVVGGVFALNMGRFAEDRGMVWYFAPDTLRWESSGLRYSEFIAWVAQGDLNGFYTGFRWNNWEKDVENLDGFTDGILIYPYLWSKECDIETAVKKPVPLVEIIGNSLDLEKEFSK